MSSSMLSAIFLFASHSTMETYFSKVLEFIKFWKSAIFVYPKELKGFIIATQRTSLDLPRVMVCFSSMQKIAEFNSKDHFPMEAN